MHAQLHLGQSSAQLTAFPQAPTGSFWLPDALRRTEHGPCHEAWGPASSTVP